MHLKHIFLDISIGHLLAHRVEKLARIVSDISLSIYLYRHLVVDVFREDAVGLIQWIVRIYLRHQFGKECILLLVDAILIAISLLHLYAIGEISEVSILLHLSTLVSILLLADEFAKVAIFLVKEFPSHRECQGVLRILLFIVDILSRIETLQGCTQFRL